MSTGLDTAIRGWRAGDGGSAAQTARRRLGQSLIWVIVIGLAIAIAVVTTVFTTLRGTQTPLHPNNTRAEGLSALTAVMADEGVAVTVTRSLDDAVEAGQNPDSLLIVADVDFVLFEEGAERLADGSAPLLLVEPDEEIIDGLDAPVDILDGGSISLATAGDPLDVLQLSDVAAVDPECEDPAATAAGAVTRPTSVYRIAGPTVDQGISCYPTTVEVPADPEAAPNDPFLDDDDFVEVTGHGLLRLPGEREVSVLGSAAALANGSILNQGDAALAMNLLGQRDAVTLYLPDFADQPSELGGGGEVQIIPPGAFAILLWGAVVLLAMILWRGRRLGPLTQEDLPVVVRAAEPVEGRAALYRRVQAHDAALAGLRAGALLRIARRLRLDSSLGPREIALQAAARTGGDPIAVQGALVDDVASSDAQLTRLAQRIAKIESEVHRS